MLFLNYSGYQYSNVTSKLYDGAQLFVKEKNMKNEKIALSPAEVSAALGISLNSTYTYIREGRIKCCRLGKRILISRTELENLINNPKSAVTKHDTKP